MNFSELVNKVLINESPDVIFDKHGKKIVYGENTAVNFITFCIVSGIPEVSPFFIYSKKLSHDEILIDLGNTLTKAVGGKKPKKLSPEEIIKKYIEKGSKGDLILYGEKINRLPDTLSVVGGTLNLMNSSVNYIPKNLIIKKHLYLQGTKINSLPDNLTVEGNLDAGGIPLNSLPKNLKTGLLNLSDTPLVKKYTREQITKMLPGVKFALNWDEYERIERGKKGVLESKSLLTIKKMSDIEVVKASLTTSSSWRVPEQYINKLAQEIVSSKILIKYLKTYSFENYLSEISNQISKKEKNNLEGSDDFAYIMRTKILNNAGRVWVDQKIISFWSTTEELTPEILSNTFNLLNIADKESYLIDVINVKELNKEETSKKKLFSYNEYMNRSLAINKISDKKTKKTIEYMSKLHGLAGAQKANLGSTIPPVGARRYAQYAPLSIRQAVQTSESFKQLFTEKEEERRLDPKCWKGYRRAGTKLKDGTRVNKCVKVKK